MTKYKGRRVVWKLRVSCQTLSMPVWKLVTIVVDDYDRPSSSSWMSSDSSSWTIRLRSPTLVVPRDGWWFDLMEQRRASCLPVPTATTKDPWWVTRSPGASVSSWVDDFDAAHDRMVNAGVEFVTEPRNEDYGRVAVFVDMRQSVGPARAHLISTRRRPRAG